MATVFYLAIFLCANASQPCTWVHTQQSFQGKKAIADCMDAGIKASARWNMDRAEKGGKMVAVGFLCDDKKPDAEGHDL